MSSESSDVAGRGVREAHDLSMLAYQAGKAHAWRRRASRLLKQVRGESSEVRGFVDDIAVLQQPITTCRRILVAGVRGGAGATTLSALLATACARYRLDGTLALETNRGHGSLAYRLGSARQLTPDMVDALLRMPPRDAATALSLEHWRANVLARPGTMSLEDYRHTSAALMRYYGLAIIDAGHDAVVVPGHLASAHCIVLAVPATLDGMRTALAWLDEADTSVRERTVPVLVEHSPGDGLNLDRALKVLRTAGGPGFAVPYDPDLAVGGPLEQRLFGQPTMAAVVRVAAAAVSVAAG